jgi:hypothetical protein
MTPAEQIKARWPEITMMMVRLGYGAPGKKRFHALFRPDNNPSCEIWNNTIVDRSTGERFDVISLFARHHGISEDDAIRQLAAELPDRQLKPIPKKRELVIPPLSYSPEQAEALAILRGITREGVDFAASTVGSLGFGRVLGYDCWVLTDGSTIAEARRMDGKKFPAVGSLTARKSHTLGGSKKGSPIGLHSKHSAKALKGLPICIVEGGPDYLALCSILWDYEAFLPVCMLGASIDISKEALAHFAGRDVWIIGHPDPSGKHAIERWGRQLQKAGCSVRGRQLKELDLNDTLLKHGADQVRKDVFFL